MPKGTWVNKEKDGQKWQTWEPDQEPPVYDFTGMQGVGNVPAAASEYMVQPQAPVPQQEQGYNFNPVDVQGNMDNLPKWEEPKPPTMQDWLNQTNPYDIYHAQINDYLEERLNQEMEENNRKYYEYLNFLHSGKEPTYAETDDTTKKEIEASVRDKFSNLAEQIKAKYEGYVQDVGNQLLNARMSHMTPQQLPFYQEIQGRDWANDVKQAFLDSMEEWKAAVPKRKEEWQKTVYTPALERLQESMRTQYQINQANRKPKLDPAPEFEGFLNKNNFTPRVRNWLAQNYKQYAAMWAQSDTDTPFTQWLIQSLGGRNV